MTDYDSDRAMADLEVQLEADYGKQCECGHRWNLHHPPEDQRTMGGLGKTTWKRHCRGNKGYDTTRGETPCRCRGFQEKGGTKMTTRNTRGTGKSAAKPAASARKATVPQKRASSQSSKASSGTTRSRVPATTLSAAEKLAKIVDERTSLREELAATRAAERELEAQLAQEVIDAEPRGHGTVVFFEKRFRDKEAIFSYAAIAIPVPHWPGGPTGATQRWHLTGAQAPSNISWTELVKFMGVNGLSTLEVLR